MSTNSNQNCFEENLSPNWLKRSKDFRSWVWECSQICRYRWPIDWSVERLLSSNTTRFQCRGTHIGTNNNRDDSRRLRWVRALTTGHPIGSGFEWRRADWWPEWPAIRGFCWTLRLNEVFGRYLQNVSICYLNSVNFNGFYTKNFSLQTFRSNHFGNHRMSGWEREWPLTSVVSINR